MSQAIICGCGGVRLKYNLFVQPEEPEVKDGLWIQTPSEKGFKDVIIKPNFLIAGALAANDVSEFKSPESPVNLYDCTLCNIAYNGFLYGAQFGLTNSTILIFRLNAFTGERETLTTIPGPSTIDSGDFYNNANISYVHNVMYYVYPTSSGVVMKPIYDMQAGVLAETEDLPTLTFTMLFYGYSSSGEMPYFVKNYKNDKALLLHSEDTTYLHVHILNLITQTVESTFKAIAMTGSGLNTSLGVFDFPTSLYNNSARITDNCSVIGDIAYLVTAAGIAPINLATETTGDLIPYPTGFFSSTYPSDVTSATMRKVITVGDKIYIIAAKDKKRYSVYTPVGPLNSTIWEFSPDTNTFTKIEETPAGFVANLAAYVPDHGIYLYCLGIDSDGQKSNYIETKQFSMISENQPNETLCLQSGYGNHIRLFNIPKLASNLPKYSNAPRATENGYENSFDFHFNDAWYYDSDFHKFPTYIGDGMKWTKIKN